MNEQEYKEALCDARTHLERAKVHADYSAACGKRAQEHALDAVHHANTAVQYARKAHLWMTTALVLQGLAVALMVLGVLL